MNQPHDDRSSLTRWRQRLGEEQIAALLQESLSVAHRTGAIESKDIDRVVVDTTVQEEAIAHPTDARLTHRAIEKLVDLAKREAVELRQSYLRLAKRAAIMVGSYTHAHQSPGCSAALIACPTHPPPITRTIARNACTLYRGDTHTGTITAPRQYATGTAPPGANGAFTLRA
jgi:IS5 family transposase